MRLYSEYIYSSIAMSDNQQLKSTLTQILTHNTVTHVFETGTYLGQGSTKMIIESFPKNKLPISFITIETNPLNVIRAKKNLKPYGFVKVVYGCSVSVEEAIGFIDNDESINNHQLYPDVFIDNIDNPNEFYINEIKGYLNSTTKTTLQSYLLNLIYYKEKQILEKYLLPMRDKKPLILLDSAGGIGYLEFQKIIELMGEFPYWLILDDIHHIKHFQSISYIQSHTDFKILAMNQEHGWAIIEHLGINKS
jgi:hypothetical protein